ncbi:hypothetical protein EDM56_12380 [Brevibacillus fluminis]|uniref:Uncharacterized protein n=1 Tax=Brevibacillus fluminis TaxID=511487 RepID=A0A3M8DPA0_9BACL|nr:hypothetical protein [Brevibacillus fluminis]RNB89943.1 hypothetical protein EDM56_12380 [Brevibacillus fluminis]
MSETMLALILKRLEVLDELKQIVFSLRDGQEEIRAEMEGLAVSLSVGEIAGRVTAIESEMRVMKADIAELRTDVAQLKQDVSNLKNEVAELKQDVAELKNGQLRQNDMLATLSYRTLDHETQLRNLRRTAN